MRIPAWGAWLREALHDLQVDVVATRLAVLRIPTQLYRIERLIMTTADDLVVRLDAATNEVAADLTAVRDALGAALANADAATQEAVAAELAKLDAPIARLEALGADEGDPVPDAPAEQPVEGEPTV